MGLDSILGKGGRSHLTTENDENRPRFATPTFATPAYAIPAQFRVGTPENRALQQKLQNVLTLLGYDSKGVVNLNTPVKILALLTAMADQNVAGISSLLEANKLIKIRGEVLTPQMVSQAMQALNETGGTQAAPVDTESFSILVSRAVQSKKSLENMSDQELVQAIQRFGKDAVGDVNIAQLQACVEELALRLHMGAGSNSMMSSMGPDMRALMGSALVGVMAQQNDPSPMRDSTLTIVLDDDSDDDDDCDDDTSDLIGVASVPSMTKGVVVDRNGNAVSVPAGTFASVASTTAAPPVHKHEHKLDNAGESFSPFKMEPRPPAGAGS